MTKIDKLIVRLISRPKDFTYAEAKTLLRSMGFEETNKGKTSGSRVKFQRKTDKVSILLHKPHTGEIVKLYVIDQLIEFYGKWGNHE
jgi:HicA toxin of bacterial toxin-antitoxin,